MESQSKSWNLPAPPGFQGLRDDVPLRIYDRHLPHWRQKGATYFVTFRLADSLPQTKLQELKQLRAEWLATNGPAIGRAAQEQLARVTMERVEFWLDQGYGECTLSDCNAANVVGGSLQFFHCDRYRLGAYVVMPNHVHAIVQPLNDELHDLEHILHSWKGYSASKLLIDGKGDAAFWQQESFDRIIRDEEHLYRSLQYIGRNPSRAGLSSNSFRLWLNRDWQAAGWDFCTP